MTEQEHEELKQCSRRIAELLYQTLVRDTTNFAHIGL